MGVGWDPCHGEEMQEAELAVPSGTPIPARVAQPIPEQLTEFHL